jgi:hypothetical protein
MTIFPGEKTNENGRISGMIQTSGTVAVCFVVSASVA